MTSPVLRSLLRLVGAMLLALFASGVSAQRYEDPPARIARLSHLEGPVAFSPAGSDEWRRALRNRTHWRGDRFWTDRRARAELQMGGAALRLDQRTAVEILDLDDRYALFELTEGTVNLSVRHLDPDDVYEIATPLFALVVDSRATVRVDVDPRSGRTDVVVWDGTATAYGERGRFPLHEGDAIAFYDATLRDYEFLELRPDGFDAYAEARDERLERAASLRYVPAGLIGYADLDGYGSWRTISDYGPVWFPSRVGAGWRPYRDGHWIWQEPWGWTWIDDFDWGFATSHYGRWVEVDRRWGWIPSPRRERPIYAPALVAFLSFGSSGGPVGWFPLGPREVYLPSYRTSRDYFARVNYGNTRFPDRGILSRAWTAYDRGQRLPDLSYRYNREDYWTAVPRETFINARPVTRSVVQQQGGGALAQLDRIRALEPRRESRFGATTAAPSAPPREVFQREVFTRYAAPPRAERADAPRSRERDTGRMRDNVRVIREAQQLPVLARDAPRGDRPRRGDARDAERDRGRAERDATRDAEQGGRERDRDAAAREAERVEREQERAARGDDREAQRAAEQDARERDRRGRDAGEREAAQRELERRSREREQAQREAQREAEQAQREDARRARDLEQSQRQQERQSRERDEAQREQERAQREGERQAQEQARRQQDAQREQQRAAREQEQAQREAQRQAEQAQREQQQAQRQAEQAQREQERQAREQQQAEREAQRQAEQVQREQQQAQREAERQAQEQARLQQEAQREMERQAREQEQAQREQQRQAEQMQREAERQAREQEQAQREQQRQAEQMQREAERQAREQQQQAAPPAERAEGEEGGRGRGRGRDRDEGEDEDEDDDERGRGRPPR